MLKEKHKESAVVTQRRKPLILKGDEGKPHRVTGIVVEPGTSREGRGEENTAFLR